MDEQEMARQLPTEIQNDRRSLLESIFRLTDSTPGIERRSEAQEAGVAFPADDEDLSAFAAIAG